MSLAMYVQNCKGGVGKTALSAFLAQLFVSHKKRVLVVDADGACGYTLRVERGYGESKGHPVLEFIAGKRPSMIVNIPSDDSSYDFVPGNITTDQKTEGLAFGSDVGRKRAFENASNVISEMRRSYDFLIFDGSPTLGRFNEILMMACDTVVIPSGIDFTEACGIVRVLARILALQEKLGSSPTVFLAPWGVPVSKKTEGVLQAYDALADGHGFNVLPPFPSVPDMTDLLFATGSLAKFLNNPAIVKRAKAIRCICDAYVEALTTVDPLKRNID